MKKTKVILITTMLVLLNRCMTFIGCKSDDDGDHHGHHQQQQEQQHDREQLHAVKATTS